MIGDFELTSHRSMNMARIDSNTLRVTGKLVLLNSLLTVVLVDLIISSFAGKNGSTNQVRNRCDHARLSRRR